MSRRIIRRTAAVLATGLAGGGFAVTLGLASASPAQAHGAPTQPISRTAACAGGGEDAGSPACKAARKANGGPFGTFDNLRVPGVNGRDRQLIPDGKLCSGGLADFKGLDLPRDDYPITKLTAGGTLNMQYRTTIPHKGTFRVFLTKQRYDPTKPLKWSDLGSKPVLTADNPPIRGGAYRMSGRLPSDRTGRHVIFTIWQTTSTPDTYYSCSDVAFGSAAKGEGTPPPKSRKATSGTPAHSAKPRPATSPRARAAIGAPALTPGGKLAAHESRLTASDDSSSGGPGRRIVSAALIVLVAVTGSLAFIRIRRARTSQRIHGERQIR